MYVCVRVWGGGRTVGQVEFVGTEANGPVPSLDLHEGHPGFTITQLQARLSRWGPLAPDVILLHAGTNDMGGIARPVASGAAAAARVRSLLNATFHMLPRTSVLLSSLVGAFAGYGGLKHPHFNALLPDVAADFTAAGENRFPFRTFQSTTKPNYHRPAVTHQSRYSERASTDAKAHEKWTSIPDSLTGFVVGAKDTT